MSKVKEFRTRKMPDDAVVYVNDDYIIWKKGGEFTGSIGAAMDITMIGIYGLEEDLDSLKYKQDKIDIINKLQSDLEEIKVKVTLGMEE
jgi:hypothetical protein